MAQFEPHIPYPLRYALPGFLQRGRVRAPSIGIDLLIFTREDRLEGAAMQVQVDDIAGGEGALRQMREDELVDDARA